MAATLLRVDRVPAWRRRAAGLGVAAAGLAASTLGLVRVDHQVALPTVLMLYLLVTVLAATVGGGRVAAATAAGSLLLANFFFTDPRFSLDMHDIEDVAALAVFAIVSLVVAGLVNVSARRAHRAAEADALAAGNELRTALLAAVSHDLRTPLAGIKASVTSLLQDDVAWTADLTRDFLVAIDAEADRLDKLVGNLLDMSRLQTGAVRALCRPTSLEEVVPAALVDLPLESRLVIDVPETLPQVIADPALLERVVANLVDNALQHAPGEAPIEVVADLVDDHVDLRVVDHGPGIPASDRSRVLQPFQRLGDSGRPSGVGLGLAVASGFVRAMAGELHVRDTPGGGLTVVVQLPAAA